ncbi:unnamed protein product [Schistosoma curassoni]|uniref:Type II toxin-antitoxin system ParD family antitoxin n=1 Tax=Schistosoma curassoni TaxID=6186 RepID=A0A183KCP1_9TREM|nr:unnamed protein product [Schistosoma curassoni]
MNRGTSVKNTLNITPPTIEQIRMAIRQSKSGEASILDNTPVEALKSEIEAQITMNSLDAGICEHMST